MTIHEAIDAGVAKLRRPEWNPQTFLELYIVKHEGKPNGFGAIALLHDPPSMAVLHGDPDKVQEVAVWDLPQSGWEAV